VKSCKDAIDLQSTLARTAVETAVRRDRQADRTPRCKLAEQAIAPLAAARDGRRWRSSRRAA
jgi:hypothetical protein